MLRKNTLFRNPELVVSLITSAYETPYTEKDHNLYPSVSLSVNSCFQYKVGKKIIWLNPSNILFENADTEFEVTKFSPWNMDHTLTIAFKNDWIENFCFMKKQQFPVSARKRSFKTEFIARAFMGLRYKDDILREQLIIDLLDQISKDSTDTYKTGDKIDHHCIKRIESAKEFIYSNYQEKIQVADMANEVNLSVFHFCRLFKKIAGHSPYQFLLLIRLEQAKKLLCEGGSVTMVANKTGFESLEHFSNAFAKYLKISPSDYKRNGPGINKRKFKPN